MFFLWLCSVVIFFVVVVVVVGVCSGFMVVQWPTNKHISHLFNFIFNLMDVEWMCGFWMDIE